jgi:hypothetical protein
MRQEVQGVNYENVIAVLEGFQTAFCLDQPRFRIE